MFIDVFLMDYVFYILILFLVVCIVFFFVNVLIFLYDWFLIVDIGIINSYVDVECVGVWYIYGYELYGFMSDDENEDGERKFVLDSNGGGLNFIGSSLSILG